MSDEQNKPNQTFNIGNVNAGVFNSGNMTISGGTFIGKQELGKADNSDEARQELELALGELKKQIEELKATHIEEAVTIQAEVKKVEELLKEDTPDKARLQIRGEDLQKAAENIKNVAPTVAQIALTVVGTIAQFMKFM